jgi:phenylalanyl-tRNA synthetase alpha chain
VGDVYRKDTVDRTHYPAFHQMEGVRLFTLEELGTKDVKEAKILVQRDLQQVLEALARDVFGDVEMRWNPDFFPFTDPSYELEIMYNGDWMEVLGSGVVLDGVMQNAGLDPRKEVGWAFGLGLERWAMKLFNISDIRLFWSKDERFISQFKAGQISQFKPYSKFPVCYKDIAFWLPQGKNDSFSENDFHAVVRHVAGDLAESVTLIDEFTHPKSGKKSLCFRINYRHMDRNLTNEEIDNYQF